VKKGGRIGWIEGDDETVEAYEADGNDEEDGEAGVDEKLPGVFHIRLGIGVSTVVSIRKLHH